MRRRDAFDRDPAGFVASWAKQENRLRRRIAAGRDRLASVAVPDDMLERAARLCLRLGTDGLRGELTLIRAARALAGLESDTVIDISHLRRVATPSLRHRLRRNPLDDAGSSTRVERAVEEVLA